MKIDYLDRGVGIRTSIKSKLDKYVFLKVVKKISGYQKRPKRFLEFGPGRGDKFDMLEEVFGAFDQVVFIDFDARVLEHLRKKYVGRKITFLHCSADKSIANHGSFDLIISSHVIEHLEMPRKHIENIRHLLSENGLAFVASPNLTSVDASRLGSRWRGYIDPTHINLMGVNCLKEMCIDEGLRVLKFGTSLYPRSAAEIMKFLVDFEFTFRDSGKGDSCSFLLRK